MKNLKDYVDSKKTGELGLLLIPIIVGLYLRAQTLKWHRLWAYDPYYFYRVATHIANGGSIFDYDPMIVTLSRRFTDDEPGLPLIWGYLSKITHIDTWTLGIYLPLIIFVLEVFVLYKLTKDAFNWRVGFVSTLFLAVIPGHLYRSHAGGIWKDTLGSLFMLMFLHSVILITKSRRLDHKKMVKYGTYLIASLYLSAFTFDGFGAFPGAVSLYLILLPLIKKPRRNEFLIAGLMVPPLVLAYFTLPTYTRESYALLPFLIASVIDLVALGLGYYLSKYQRGKIIYGGVLVLVSVLLVYFVLFNPPSFLEKTSKMAWQFLLPSKYGLSAQSRANNLKLLFNTWFSVSLILAMLGVFYTIKNIKKRENLLIFAWFVVLTFLGVATVRLTFIMSFAVAVTAALGMEFIYVELSKRLDFKKAVSISIAVLLIGVVPTSYEGKNYVSMPPFPPDYWLDALDWMHDNIAGEVVFNWWDWGYWLQIYGMKTLGDNGYQNVITSTGYIKLLLVPYSRVRPVFRQYYLPDIKKTMQAKIHKTYDVSYLVISQDFFYKVESVIHTIPNQDNLIEQPDMIILPCNNVLANIRICSFGGYRLIIRLGRRDSDFDVKFYSANYEVVIKDIVIENPVGHNYVYHVSPSGVIVYLAPINAFVFGENSVDLTLVQLFVYENETSLKLVWKNGFVKVYSLLPHKNNTLGC